MTLAVEFLANEIKTTVSFAYAVFPGLKYRLRGLPAASETLFWRCKNKPVRLVRGLSLKFLLLEKSLLSRDFEQFNEGNHPM